jgi:hypothetical protein
VSTVPFVISQSQTGSADFCVRSRYDSIYSKITGKMGNCSVHPVTDRMGALWNPGETCCAYGSTRSPGKCQYTAFKSKPSNSSPDKRKAQDLKDMEMEFIFSVGFAPTSGVSVNVDLCECRVKRAALHVLNGSNKL